MRNFLSEDCFIISPIGKTEPHDDEMRIHVERVRMEIINPALKEINATFGLTLKADRTDMRQHPGNIMEQLLSAILSDQIIFTVITKDVRPNVYYELGIAHSAARPVIVLKDASIGRREFDIYHIRTTDYALDGVSQNATVQSVIEQIKKILEKDDDEFAFSKYDPLNRHNAHLTFFRNFRDVTYDDWGKLLNRADKRIDFFGATLLDLARDDNNQFAVIDGDRRTEVSLKNFLAAKILLGGIHVSIILLDEENLSIESLILAGKHGVDLRQISQLKDEISESTERWSAFGKGLQTYDIDTLASFLPIDQKTRKMPHRGSFRLVKMRYGAVKFRMTLTDKEVLATPVFYLPGRNSAGPALGIRSGFSFYDYLRDEIDHLKSINGDYEVAAATFPPIERPA